MRLWRLCSRHHAAFDGEGARLYGGRWNHPGAPVVYTSESLALAALEYFVNLDADLGPADLVATRAEVPGEVAMRVIAPRDLPRTWRKYPAPGALRDLGTAWALEGATAVLAVPSAVIPQERNYLLNPAHPEFRRIRVHPPEPFRFDPRMWK